MEDYLVVRIPSVKRDEKVTKPAESLESQLRWRNLF